MRRPPRAVLAAAALALLATAVPAQRTRPRVPGAPEISVERGVVGPGQGPVQSFQAEDWEFWWASNGEMLVDLRTRLSQLEVPGTFTDFRALTPADRDGIHALLIAELEQARGPLRAELLMALAKGAEPGVGALLLESLEDGSADVRAAGTLALGVLGDAATFATVRARCTDRDVTAEERFLAAIALGLAGDLEGLRALLDPATFETFPVMVRSAVVHAAGLSGNRELFPLLEELLRKRALENAVVRGYAAGAMARTAGPAARSVLEDLLDDDAIPVRRAAALAFGRALAHTGDDAAAAVLQRRIPRESDSVVRNFLHVALGRIGGRLAIQVLGRGVAPARGGSVRGGFVQPSVRPSEHLLATFAALGLGLTGETRLQDPLADQLRRENRAESKAALALGLGLLGPGQGSKVLLDELGDTRDPRLRAHLALACGLAGVEKADRTLETWLREEHDLRLLPAAAAGRALLGHRGQAAEQIAARIGDERSAADRVVLLYALDLVGDRRAIEVARRVFEQRSSSVDEQRYAAILLGDLADRRARRRLADLGEDFDYTAEPSLFDGLFLQR